MASSNRRCHIIVICLLTVVLLQIAKTHSSATWGSECPRECQCHLTPLGRVSMARWVLPMGKISLPTDPRPVRVAMCVLGGETMLNKLFRRIPADTQVLTMLQTQECPPIVLMEHHTEHLQHILALEIRAHVTQTSSSHLALGNEALKPLRKLQYLSLTGVDLAAQPVGLSKMHGLRYLSFRNNQLDVFPDDVLAGLLSLEELTIADNELSEIPPLAFIDLPALRRVHLNGNRIQSLDANSFVNLDELELLDVSSNNISDISIISFPPLPNLRWLHLQDNPIRIIFLNAFHHLNNTRILTLGHKQHPMHIMKHSFVGLAALKNLFIPNLDNHILEKDVFQGLQSIQSLAIRGQVKMIGPEAFEGTGNLESLSLSHCRIRTLSTDAFKGLSKLKSLDLSHNAIMKIPTGLLDRLTSLEELQLQQNNLRHLPFQMLPNVRLHMLRLENNPWHCTCSMAKWNKASIGRVKTTSSRHCSSSTSPNNTVSADFLGMESGMESTTLLRGGCHSGRIRVRYVRDPSLRPLCYNPPEVRDKRVFDAVRKHLHCFE